MTETAKLEALTPCPFCGRNDLGLQQDFSEDEPTHAYAWHVFCRDCHCHGRNNFPIGWAESEAEAITAWNTRALSISRPAMKALDELRARAAKLAASPLGWGQWSVGASGGKPVLKGGSLGNIASGYLATWDEFELIAAAMNALPAILSSLSPPTGGWQLVGYLKPAHPAAVEPLFIDSAARTEDWQKSVFSQPVYAPLPSPPEAGK